MNFVRFSMNINKIYSGINIYFNFICFCTNRFMIPFRYKFFFLFKF